MTHDDAPPESDARRSFMKKGVLASGGLALGLSGLVSGQEGNSTTQEGNSTSTQEETPTATPAGEGGNGGKALMFNDEFRPGAQFRVTSPVLEQNPDVEGVQEGDIWSEYNTRTIQYLNTNEQVTFFPAHDAEVQQGNVYELHNEFSLFADEMADEGVMSVSFEPVGEDDVLFPGDGQLDPVDDYEVIEGGGKALVQLSNYFPGSLLRITSDVENWVPGPNVQGSDIFSEYNSRFAEYLNTNDEFLIYPAQDANISTDAVYVVRDEFDITDPEGRLVTVDLDRVNENDLPDDLL